MKLLTLACFLSFCSLGLAQNIELSPLSRFGLGDLKFGNTAFADQLGRGLVAFSDYSSFNINNPASLGFLRLTDYELGLQFKYRTASDSKGNSSSDWSGNLNHLSVGIPFQNTINEILNYKSSKYLCGLNFGLLPYSTTGYSYSSIDSSNQTIGKIGRRLDGSGSINKFIGGFGVQSKNISLGLSMAYLFGSQRYEQELVYLNQPGGLNSYLEDKVATHGFELTLGAMYKKVLNKKWMDKDKSLKANFLNFGASVSLPGTLKLERSSLYIARSDNSLVIPDTIKNSTDPAVKTNLPFKIHGGVYYNHGEKFGYSLDLGHESWTKVQLLDIQKATLTNSFSSSIAAWFRPDITGYGKFFKRCNYRFAVNYLSDYRIINGTQGKSISALVGIGIPFVFQRQVSMVHLSFEAGKWIWKDDLKQNFYNIKFAFNLSDNEWFLKRRYD